MLVSENPSIDGLK